MVKVDEILYEKAKQMFKCGKSQAEVHRTLGISICQSTMINRSINYKEYKEHSKNYRYFCQDIKSINREFGSEPSSYAKDFNKEWYFNPKYRDKEGDFI